MTFVLALFLFEPKRFLAHLLSLALGLEEPSNAQLTEDKTQSYISPASLLHPTIDLFTPCLPTPISARRIDPDTRTSISYPTWRSDTNPSTPSISLQSSYKYNVQRIPFIKMNTMSTAEMAAQEFFADNQTFVLGAQFMG